MFNAYEMIIDDKEMVFKTVRAKENIKKLKEVYGGNGEFVRIRDVTEEFKIDLQKVANALLKANFGEIEKDIIISILENYKNSY